MDYQTELLNIAANIKKLRKERKLTIREVATRCGMERTNISRIESGRTNLTIKTICAICNALGVQLKDILT